MVGRRAGRRGDSGGTVGGPPERLRQLWVAKGGSSSGFFQGIVCADILETLNSFNIDVLGYIKGLSLNAMIICIGTQGVVCMVVNN